MSTRPPTPPPHEGPPHQGPADPALAAAPATGTMLRRTAIGALALAAAGGGLWWRLRQEAAEQAAAGGQPTPGAAPGSVTPGLAAWWQRPIDTPNGPPLRLADFAGRRLLLNFWASWCPPCVKEMPLLDRFWREQAGRGWQVLGLAVDNPDPVRAFLLRQPVGYPIGIVGFAGTELATALGNEAGGLPFTVVFDASGQPLLRHSGEILPGHLQAWAAGPPQPSRGKSQ